MMRKYMKPVGAFEFAIGASKATKILHDMLPDAREIAKRFANWARAVAKSAITILPKE